MPLKMRVRLDESAREGALMCYQARLPAVPGTHMPADVHHVQMNRCRMQSWKCCKHSFCLVHQADVTGTHNQVKNCHSCIVMASVMAGS